MEHGQLGMPFHASEYVSAQEWVQLRADLVQKSLATNPALTDPTMTAYTPGETVQLLDRPEVRQWHEYVGDFLVPDDYETIVLVPCAKTKPWDAAHSKRSSLYRAYHEVIRLSEIGELPPTYFATVSEPLGIVPQDRWSDFVQYDNPGLFRDDYLRTGMTKVDWLHRLGERKFLPFDETAYQKCIHRLGLVASRFLCNHVDRRIVSFVDSSGTQSTHQEMLDTAIEELDDIQIERHLKRDKPRVTPTEYIISKIIC